MEKRRYRYAPSPTGVLHVGNARTAIYNWLLARHYKGTLIIRIEDTDKERSTPESANIIIQDLKWLGLDWDEGPDVGGACGPYRQSERQSIYEKYQKELLDKKCAYECFCSSEQLESEREALLKEGKMPKYSGRCRNLTPAEKQKSIKQGLKPVIRFLVKDGASVIVRDDVRGEVKFERSVIGDFVIFKSDGGPTYQFACVVDDILMKVTHIVRGDDHLPNTPKQILLYEALNVKPPAFGHLPMVLGTDRKKLSKRHGAVSVGEYRKLGYLPEAFTNFLILLGWSSQSEDEILDRERLIKEFDEKRLSSSPSIFETPKLDWMNGQYIRKLSQDDFFALELPFIEKEYDLHKIDTAWLKKVLAVLQTAVVKLPDICGALKIFFEEKFLLSDDVKRQLQSDEFKKVVFAMKDILEKEAICDFEEIKKRVQEKTGAKGKNLFFPLRLAITGEPHGPELSLVFPLIGHEGLKTRVTRVIKGLD